MIRTIDAYYSCGCDSRELFAPFEVAKDPGFETYLNVDTEGFSNDLSIIDLPHETYTSVLKYNYDRETKQHECVIEKINE